jgi:hypothetical protein
MYYIALRYRGVQKIIYEGNLEGGMYDLSLTESFGPLDHEANGFRNWARMYVSGASFWEIDWERVLSFFGHKFIRPCQTCGMDPTGRRLNASAWHRLVMAMN